MPGPVLRPGLLGLFNSFVFYSSSVHDVSGKNKPRKTWNIGEDCSFPLASIWIFQWLLYFLALIPLLVGYKCHQEAWVCEEINASTISVWKVKGRNNGFV